MNADNTFHAGAADGSPGMKRSDAMPKALLLLFGLIWVVLAIEPLYRQDWLLENVIVFIAVPGLILGYFRRPLSSLSYVLIFVFLALHEIGAHYTYSEVPYDSWWQSLTGFSLNASFGWERNHFDRLLHLLFGVLLAPSLRELLVRSSGCGAPGATCFRW
jgi:putative membrane protein